MILSNKLHIQFNKENINRDFDIYMIEKEKGNFFKSNILDITGQEFKAKSVVYSYGTKWFAMFAKDSFDYNLFKKVIADQEEEAIIHKVNIFEQAGISVNILAQLLFNTLNTPSEESYSYNNIFGKLFYFTDKSIKKEQGSFYAASLSLSEDCCFTIKVQTFSCITNFKNLKHTGTKYLIDENGKFRKKLKNDNYPDSMYYINKSLNKKKKNKIDFLNFKNYTEFCNSKIGIFDRFMKDVELYLKEYIYIENKGYEDYTIFNFAYDGFENKQYNELLKNKLFYIIDEIKNEKSKNLIEQIVSELKEFYGVNISKGDIKAQSYIIRIIYSEDYYIKNKIQEKDPHKNINLYNIVQHITVDNFKFKKDKTANPAFKKVIQELIIKSDINHQKLTIVNWNKNKIWTFVKVYKKNQNCKKKQSDFIYCKMTIFPDGSFKINCYEDWDFDNEELNIIEYTYKKYSLECKCKEIEGMFYTDYNNINVIMKTEQTTIPNFKPLSRNLELADKENVVDRLAFIEHINDFMDEEDKYKDQSENLITKLKQDTRQYITIGEILKLMKPSPKSRFAGFGKSLNKYLFDTTGILLHAIPKDESVRNTYFESILDIKYFYNENKLYYFVGPTKNGLNQSLHNACSIREVVTIGQEIQFPEILDLLSVEFVRNGQYTVLPFPFKYINEFILKH